MGNLSIRRWRGSTLGAGLLPCPQRSSASMSCSWLFLGGLVSTRARLRFTNRGQCAVHLVCRSSILQRTANYLLTVCLTPGGKRKFSTELSRSQLKNLMTVVVTMRFRFYKGNPEDSDLPQYLWDLRGSLEQRVMQKDRSWSCCWARSGDGLTSPVGLEQGRFKVSWDKSGKATAVNGRNNVGLFNCRRARPFQRDTTSPRTATLITKAKADQSPCPI